MYSTSHSSIHTFCFGQSRPEFSRNSPESSGWQSEGEAPELSCINLNIARKPRMNLKFRNGISPVRFQMFSARPGHRSDSDQSFVFSQIDSPTLSPPFFASRKVSQNCNRISSATLYSIICKVTAVSNQSYWRSLSVTSGYSLPLTGGPDQWWN